MRRIGKRPLPYKVLITLRVMLFSFCRAVTTWRPNHHAERDEYFGCQRVLLLLLLLLAQPAMAEVTIPVVGRPKPFYNVAGNSIKFEASVSTKDLAYDDTLVYTLTIRGLLNAPEVQRPDLLDDDAFRKDWQCEADSSPVTEADGTRIFRYRLRALRRDVTFIPSFTLAYYAPEARRFLKARVDSRDITLTAKVAPPKVLIPLEVPAFAERLAADSTPPVPNVVWLLLALGVPGLFLGGCFVWNLVNPASFRAARRRRHRAARLAIKQLRQHPTAPRLATILAQYLAWRFHGQHVPQTPEEVATLTREHLDAETQAKWVQLFRELDERRFAPSPELPADDLVGQAVALIEAQEAMS